MASPTSRAPRRPFQKETSDATGEQEPGARDRAGRAVQEAGPHLRGRADRRGAALPARRRERAQEPVVGGQGGDGRRRLQRLALLVAAGDGEAGAGGQAPGRDEEGPQGRAEGQEAGEGKAKAAKKAEGRAHGGEGRRLRLRRLRRDLP